ncbi:MAG TPA: DUF1491 domain-containing protein [Rhodospirillaceae bacterium]|nr:hypothetical protein [Rhodospirillaceae bacterium]HAA92818.1 DUF1491 domain-containing protein [Rhodospirillaceae bacterium]HAT34658.1 DUF1491 domain-containing protein [Rhodospirillaceae bacterium]|tara:strand:+ start:306 stop:644 length:339 start_codon:yes stop_codon:yes gene_type:complete
MSNARLPTELWVKAHIARCSSIGVPITVIKRGDPDSGIVILKLNRFEAGWEVQMQGRDENGAVVWQPALEGRRVQETDADAFIERQRNYDPDIWVIEIEDREERNLFENQEM